jgi:hypothetical protein
VSGGGRGVGGGETSPPTWGPKKRRCTAFNQLPLMVCRHLCGVDALLARMGVRLWALCPHCLTSGERCGGDHTHTHTRTRASSHPRIPEEKTAPHRSFCSVHACRTATDGWAPYGPSVRTPALTASPLVVPCQPPAGAVVLGAAGAPYCRPSCLVLVAPTTLSATVVGRLVLPPAASVRAARVGWGWRHPDCPGPVQPW